MANNYKHSGARIRIVSASGAITVGKLVAQEGFIGIALTSIDSGAAGWIAISGVWYITVCDSTAVGDYLCVPATTVVPTEDVDIDDTNMSRTPGAASTIVFGRALTAVDSDHKAQVMLLPQAAVGAMPYTHTH